MVFGLGGFTWLDPQSYAFWRYQLQDEEDENFWEEPRNTKLLKWYLIWGTGFPIKKMASRRVCNELCFCARNNVRPFFNTNSISEKITINLSGETEVGEVLFRRCI
jgi:hypothetical protein